MARTPSQFTALGVAIAVMLSMANPSLSQGLGQDEPGLELDGKKLFDKETFGGNGRTCKTCHSREHRHPHLGRCTENHRKGWIPTIS